MSNSAQVKANRDYRARMTQRGLARFEVMADPSDRDLIKALARRLTEDGPEADKVRVAVRAVVVGDPPKAGGILAALRRSPLVGIDLDVSRAREEGRKVEL